MTNERARRIVDAPAGTALPDSEAPDTERPAPGPAAAAASDPPAAAAASDPPAAAAASDPIDDTTVTADGATVELDLELDLELTASDQPASVAVDQPEDPDVEDLDEPETVEEDQSAIPEDDAAVASEYESIPSVLEALLFVADEPIAASALGRALDLKPPQVRRGLDELAEALRDGARGVRLQQGPDGAQLVTAPEVATTVEHFLGLEANRRLSNAALETLAIVAYRQPVTRHVIDQIRGVSSDGAIATLRTRGLIEGIGRAPGPGRPLLFSTTQRFLEHFGLERPDELPPLPEDVRLAAEAQGAQLALEAAVEGEIEAVDEGDEASQLAFDDQPVATEGDETVAEDDDLEDDDLEDDDLEDDDLENDDLEDDDFEDDALDDDPELEISDDLGDLSRAASAALGTPAEASDSAPNE